MKKTILGIVTGCLIAISLLAVSCSQTDEETTQGTGITVTTEQKEGTTSGGTVTEEDEE